MKFELADGTSASLHAIVQTVNYCRDYKEPPPDAVEEIKRLAKLQLSSNCWRPAPMLLIGVEADSLNDLLCRRKLPSVMCIAELMSFRVQPKGPPRPAILNIVWLQDDFLPYFSPKNEAAFRQIKWDDHSAGRQAPTL